MNKNYKLNKSPLLLISKRLFDIIISLIGLIISVPIVLIIILVIFSQDCGAPFFTQERIGYRGKPFTLYKFRTMCVSAEVNRSPVLCKDNDARLTKVGSFLRTYHLDEIPQLWNVLKGDMSLVGYRPERAFFIEKIMKINPKYSYLYQLRPGIFSKATLYNGYTDTMNKMLIRLRMDLEYIQEMSFWFDFKIMFLTLFYILSGKKI